VSRPSAGAEQANRSEQAPLSPGSRQGPRTPGGVGVVSLVQAVKYIPLEGLELGTVHHVDPTGRQNREVGLPDAELIRRYNAGEPLQLLATDAELSRSGLYERLRRLGLPRTTRAAATISDDVIRQAFDEHGSISAVARALGVSRNRAIAEGQRLGLRDLSPNIPDDIAEQYRQERSLAKLAEHYGTSAVRGPFSWPWTLRPSVDG
jgi:hypothetical protein